MALDIQIKVDPGNSVQTAKAVTDALAKAEDQGAKVGSAVSKGLREGSTAADKAKTSVAALNKELKKTETAKPVNWGAKFGEMRTGVTMGIAGQLVGQAGDLQGVLTTLTDITGLKIGGTGSALGFMFGGPMGAAAGMLIDTIGTRLGGALDDIYNKDLRNQRAASEGYVRRMQEMDELGKAEEEAIRLLDQERAARDALDASIGGANRIIKEQSEVYSEAKDQVVAYTFALEKLREEQRLGVAGWTKADAQRQEIEITRGLRDATLAQTLAAKGYGKEVTDINLAQQHQLDRLVDLSRAHLDGVLTTDQLTKATGGLGSAAKRAAEGFKSLAEARNVALGAPSTWQGGEAMPRDLQGNAFAYDGNQQKAGDGSTGVDAYFEQQQVMEDYGKWQSEFDEKNKKAVAGVSDLGKAMNDLRTNALSIGDAFVDAFTDAEFSASKFFESLSKQMAKQAVSNLINVGFGAAGLGGGRTGFDSMVPGGPGAFLPGFATGGDMLVGGSGGPDSKIAAFRVTPGETIHVRTPEQRAQAQGGGQAPVINVINKHDADRDLMHVVASGRADREIVNVFRRNPGALKALLSR
jgi:hypothetical protein